MEHKTDDEREKKWNKNGMRMWGKKSAENVFENRDEKLQKDGDPSALNESPIISAGVKPSQFEFRDEAALREKKSTPPLHVSKSEPTLSEALDGLKSKSSWKKVRRVKRSTSSKQMPMLSDEKQNDSTATAQLESDDAIASKESRTRAIDSGSLDKDLSVAVTSDGQSDGNFYKKASHYIGENIKNEKIDERTFDEGGLVKGAAQEAHEGVQNVALSRGKRSWGERRNGYPWSLVKRAAAATGRAHVYQPEGPKRSWRTNVIRVWGKRGGE
jgi:hypothetical protein